MSSLTLGSLFSGFGGIDLAIENVFGARTAWVSDIEPGPCKVLAYRFPHAPNLGDITKVDWTQVEPVDIIAGGSPCQDISSAGRMAGMREGTRSNLWVEMRDAIATLRPRYVIWENVGAARSTAAASAMESDPGLLGDHPAGQPVLRALGRVLGDLASLGYVGGWHSLRAADVGAPHGRLRFFVLAADANGGRGHEAVKHDGRGSAAVDGAGVPDERDCDALRAGPERGLILLPTPAACNPNDGENPETWLARRERVKLTANNGNGTGMPLSIAVQLLPTPRVSDTNGAGAHGDGGLDLRTAVTLLPTPTTEPNTGNGHARNLRKEVQLLPTPRATRGGSTTEVSYALGGQRSDDDRTQGLVLLPGAEMKLLPTPVVSDSQLPPVGGAAARGYGTQLREAATMSWGQYAAAIARWEGITRPAPSPTKPGRNGRPKLNPEFAAWMMGAAPGWITDSPGVTDNEALRMAGNGVVQQQAEAALRIMLNRMETAA